MEHFGKIGQSIKLLGLEVEKLRIERKCVIEKDFVQIKEGVNVRESEKTTKDGSRLWVTLEELKKWKVSCR